MDERQFYISKNGVESGPFSLDQIATDLKNGQISTTDFIFDDAKDDWILLVEHKELMAKLKANKPKSNPKAKNKTNDKKRKETGPTPILTEWYILKGENKFGPFPYTDVIKMLQEKVVFEFDYAWQNGMKAWMRIAELDEFKPEHIKKLKGGLMPEIENVFFRRKHPRVPISGTIIVHDNRSVWKGQGLEISSGGAAVIMDNAMVVPGQTLYLHFKPQNGLPAFNTICEVVSKKFVEGVRDKKAPICYGLKFKSLNEDTQKFLVSYTKYGGMKAA